MDKFCTFVQEPRTQRRLNGLQLPLNYQQVIGWIVLIITALINFIIMIEIQFHELKVASIITFVTLYVCHVSSHITAAILDPSERELRKLKVINVPEFDRNVHAHVIENGRCHLCNIYTSSKNTKHCSLCNKCVDNFDHHCKWLNNCVGQRNYAAFITCVTTALLISLFTTTLCLTDIVLFLTKPKYFSNEAQEFINCTLLDKSYHDKYCRNSISFLIFLIIFGLCALGISCALLHLCCFHVYISCLGVSTYEYIVNSDHRKKPLSNNSTNKCCLPHSCMNDYIYKPRKKKSNFDGTENIEGATMENKASNDDNIIQKSSVSQSTEDSKVTRLVSAIMANEIERAKKILFCENNKIRPENSDS